jgi:peroxiredoxin Q/BCP
MLQIGNKAPAFTLKDQEGKEHALSDYAGKWVLLYFYPKDMTPGCTIEACGLRDSYADFKKINAVVLGVSKDSVKRHARFAQMHSLPFPLLADESGEMLQAYEGIAEKSMFGKKYMGILRISYLIDPNGMIAKVYEKVKPSEHASEVIADLRRLAK